MKKKILIIVSIILLILLVSSFITSRKDRSRVRNNIEPKYTIKIVSKDEKKITYIGLGYKVIRYIRVDKKEEFKSSYAVKYGSWFMKFDRPNKEELLEKLNEINNYISDYLANIRVDKNFNYVYSYVDNESKKVVIGLMDNSKEKQESFINDVFTSCCGSKYIEDIKENNYIEFKESKEVLKAKVLENNTGSILVEVIEESKSFKKGDKVSVNVLNYESLNIEYEKDMIVNIVFDGMIQETYPPQISTKEIFLDINDYQN